MEYDLIDTYKELTEKDNPSVWLTCPICIAKPRIWCFDNGRFAACKCSKKYSGPNITAIVVMPYYRSHGTLAGFPDNELRDNWNLHIIKISKTKILTEKIDILINT